jgi:hypothetical protein
MRGNHRVFSTFSEDDKLFKRLTGRNRVQSFQSKTPENMQDSD